MVEIEGLPAVAPLRRLLGHIALAFEIAQDVVDFVGVQEGGSWCDQAQDRVAQRWQCDLEFVHREVVARHQCGLRRDRAGRGRSVPTTCCHHWRISGRWREGGGAFPGVGEGFGRFAMFEGVVEAFHVQVVEKFVV